jgi:hypothetical protein
MPVSTTTLRVGSCYVTTGADVRKIVAFEGSYVIYVVGRSGTFPVWNKRWWLSTTREEFAREAQYEVPCEGRAR